MADAGSPFDDLPLELLEGIFNHIHDEKELQGLRAVNRSWYDGIGETYGVTLLIRNGNWKECFRCRAKRLKVIFRSLTIPFLKTMEDKSVMKKINSLTLSGCLFCNHMVPIFQECTNLQTLVLSKLKMLHKQDDYEPEGFNPATILPALKYLILEFHGGNLTETSMGFFQTLLPILTRSGKGKLASIQLHTCRTFGHPVMNIARHKASISEPNIWVNNFSAELIQRNQSTLLELLLRHEGNCSIITHAGTRTKEFFAVQTVKMEFDEKLVNNFEEENLGIGSLYWRTMWPRNCLKCFEISGFGPNDYPTCHRIFKSNADTLKKVSLDFVMNDDINGSDFSCLENLEVFELENKCDTVSSLFQMSEINNIRNMTKSIRILTLSTTIQLGGRFEDFSAFAFRTLENVEVFKFTAKPWFRFGRVENSFLSRNQLSNLITWLPKLKTLKLKNSFIEDEEGDLKNTVPLDTILWILETPELGLRCISDDHKEFKILNISIQPNFRCGNNSLEDEMKSLVEAYAAMLCS